MRKRMIRWLIGSAIALMLASGLAVGGGRPPVAYGESPTPTPTQDTNSQPGGGGGSGGGGG